MLHDVESNINIPLAIPPLFFVMLRMSNLMVFAVYHGMDTDRIQTLPDHACVNRQATNSVDQYSPFSTEDG